MPRRRAAARKKKRRIAPHNLVVAVSTELGALGLLALAGVGAATVLLLRRPTRYRLLRAVLGVQPAAVAAHALFYNAFFEDPAVWVMLALIAVCAYEQPRQGESRERVDEVRRLEDPPEPEEHEARDGEPDAGAPPAATAPLRAQGEDGQG